jgi:hypothetical protein
MPEPTFNGVTVGSIEAVDCGSIMRVDAGASIRAGNVKGTRTPLGVVADEGSRVEIGNFEHDPEQPEKRPKYFSGFSFQKGDHLKE